MDINNMQSSLDELLDLQIYCNTIYKGKYYKIKMVTISAEEITESEYNNTKKELNNEL